MAQSDKVSQPFRLPLVNKIQSRDPYFNKDARIINGFAEFDPLANDYFVQRRPGYGAPVYTGSGAGMGIYTYEGPTPIVMYIAGGNFYANGVNYGTIDSTPGKQYSFAQTGGMSPRVVFGNGVKAYYVDPAALAAPTQIVDPAFPTSFVGGIAYLDGFLFVMDPAGGIWGTKNLNDPATWDALNLIYANAEPDAGVAIAKHLTYIIAFKQWNTQVFYDAGNPTGSPLAPVQAAQIQTGCVSAESIQEIDGTLLWMSTNKTASPQIARMDNLNVKVVSIPPVERILDQQSYTTIHSFIFKHGGHRFYGVTSVESNFTLVYDLDQGDQGMWYKWTDKNGNYWPISAMGYFKSSSNTHFVQHESNGNVYPLDGDYEYPGDDGEVIPVEIYTPNFDGGVGRRKHCNHMGINADQVASSSIEVRWSDDDYTTWSSTRTVNLGATRPILTSLGTFYRRAFHFRHALFLPFRLRSADLQIDLGTL